MKLGTLLLFLVCLKTFATPLPGDHFLYPRSFEPLWMTSIESPLGFSGLRRNLDKCDQEFTYNAEFRYFHCNIGALTSEVSLVPEFNSKNFGDLTFFGETHTNQKGQEYLAEVISASPEGFFNVLALEMLNEWAQKDIDELINNDGSMEDWKSLLSKHWNYDSQGYLKVIKAALSKGMRIIALDDRRTERAFSHNDSFSEDLIYRDKVMAKNLISHMVRNPNDRVVALTGKLHSFQSLSQMPITISEIVKLELPDVETKTILLFNYKRATLFRSHYLNHNLPFRLEAEGSLSIFADQFVFFQ